MQLYRYMCSTFPAHRARSRLHDPLHRQKDPEDCQAPQPVGRHEADRLQEPPQEGESHQKFIINITVNLSALSRLSSFQTVFSLSLVKKMV